MTHSGAQYTCVIVIGVDCSSGAEIMRRIITQWGFICFIVWVFLFKSIGSMEVEAAPAPEALSADEYGMLYVMEKRERSFYPWRLGLNYGFEFGNPYLDVHSLSGSIEHSIGRYFWLGVQATKFIPNQTVLMRQLWTELQIAGLVTSMAMPNYSLYGVATLVPLSGHLNFFGSMPVQMELDVRLGIGQVYSTDQSKALAGFWSALPTVYFDHFGFQFGFGQEMELGVDSSHSVRLRGDTRFFYQF